jgi:hypothetical protein
MVMRGLDLGLIHDHGHPEGAIAARVLLFAGRDT